MTDAIAPLESRRRRATEQEHRRGRQHACALDFLVYGDDPEHGRHAERCVFGSGDPCSRDYDTTPYPEARPGSPNSGAGEQFYAGTAIGALYGLGGVEAYVGELAGWNVT